MAARKLRGRTPITSLGYTWEALNPYLLQRRMDFSRGTSLVRDSHEVIRLEVKDLKEVREAVGTQLFAALMRFLFVTDRFAMLYDAVHMNAENDRDSNRFRRNQTHLVQILVSTAQQLERVIDGLSSARIDQRLSADGKRRYAELRSVAKKCLSKKLINDLRDKIGSHFDPFVAVRGVERLSGAATILTIDGEALEDVYSELATVVMVGGVESEMDNLMAAFQDVVNMQHAIFAHAHELIFDVFRMSGIEIPTEFSLERKYVRKKTAAES